MVKITSLLCAAIATMAAEACYTGGIDWPNRENAYYHAARACRGYDGIRGAFQNVYFKPSSESPYPATVCVNGDGNWHTIFQFQNLRNYGLTLTPDFCNDSLNRLIRECGKGGVTTSQSFDWLFRADPNEGSC